MDWDPFENDPAFAPTAAPKKNKNKNINGNSSNKKIATKKPSTSSAEDFSFDFSSAQVSNEKKQSSTEVLEISTEELLATTEPQILEFTTEDLLATTEPQFLEFTLEDLENTPPDLSTQVASINNNYVPVKRQETKPTKLTTQQLAERNRLYEQAILMLNYKELSNKSKNNKRFKNIARLITPDNENPAVALNELFRKGIKKDILLNSNSAELSNLTPMIRIFKQYSLKNSFGDVSLLNIELPLQQKYELEDLESIFKNTSGRGGGIGLKGVTMQNIGGGTRSTPANSEAYTVNLEFTFADFSELFKERFKYYPTKEEQEAGFIEPIPVSFVHLFTQNIQDSSQISNIEKFRLKLILGWHVNKNANEVLTSDFIEEIENLKQEFYLTYFKHEINFDDSGLVSLKITYNTYIDAAINMPIQSNLLFDMKNGDFNPNTNNQVEKETLIEKKNTLEQKLKEAKGKERNVLSQKLQQVNQELEKFTKTMLENKYRRFINNIYINGNLKYFTIKEQDFSNFEKTINNFVSRNKTYAESKEEYEMLEKSIKNVSTFTEESSTNIVDQNALKELNSKSVIIDKNKKSKNGIIKESALRDIEQDRKIIENIIKKQSKNKKENQKIKIIPYFYLGDLIDSVLSGGVYGEDNFYKKKVKILIGSMYFYDYGHITENYSSNPIIEPVSTNKKQQTKTYKFLPDARIINIADIPISLSVYHRWFMEEIVNNSITTLTFQQFMDLIFQKLINYSLSNRVYPWAPTQQTTMMSKQITLVKNEKRWNKNSANSNNLEQTQDTDFNTQHFRNDNRLVNLTQDSLKTVEELEYVYYICGVDQTAHRHNSNYEEDIRVGLRHLYFHNEKGFVKTIKFNKIDNPNKDSSNIANANSTVQMKLLSGYYNADVSMFGNSFFRVGELVYVNPTIGATGVRSISMPMDSGANKQTKDMTVEELAKEMGIGGYYRVADINSKIGIGDYSTDVKLIWESKGDIGDDTKKYGISIQVQLEELKEKD